MRDDLKYLDKIHKKIRYKKIKDNLIGSIGSIAICIYLIAYQPIQEDLLFDNLFESLSYYEWEIKSELSNDEIFYYLIDNTCIEDYDSLLDNEMIEIIEKMNL